MDYVTAVARLDTYVAREGDGVPVGIVLVARHFRAAAVPDGYRSRPPPSRYRRALLSAVEDDLADGGVHLLQVNTVGMARQTRITPRLGNFYEACGFESLDELRDPWGDNCCLITVKTLPPHHG